jgi:hypothetical protein
MASDVGVVKIGISSNPFWRLAQVRVQLNVIKRLSHAWGMPSREDAIAVERTAHERFSLVGIGKEMFRLSPETAASVIVGILSEKGIPIDPFDCEQEHKRKPSDSDLTKPFTLRLEINLRKRAERVARLESRTLSSLLTYALDREVTALEEHHDCGPLTAD